MKFSILFLFIGFSSLATAQNYFGTYKIDEVQMVKFKASDSIVSPEDLTEYQLVGRKVKDKFRGGKIVLNEDSLKLIWPTTEVDAYAVEKVSGNTFQLKEAGGKHMNVTIEPIASLPVIHLLPMVRFATCVRKNSRD